MRIVLRQACLGERKRPDGLEQIIPDKPSIKSVLAKELGQSAPIDQWLFFSRATHREPMLLSHDYPSIDPDAADDARRPLPSTRQGATLDHAGESAARTLASLDVQANQFTRPGHGSCHKVGKMLFDELIAGYAHQQDLAGKTVCATRFYGRVSAEAGFRFP